MRNITIEVQPNGRPLGEVEQAALALPSLRQLPPGITQGALGDAEEMASLLTDFGMAMLTGVLCIYMVLVLLLKDFVQPGTILTALVLSVPGAMLALFLAGSTLSMPASSCCSASPPRTPSCWWTTSSSSAANTT